MKLILSDRPLIVPKTEDHDIKLIDLSQLKITNCIGCFGCWTKTPGKCVIRDDAVQVYPLIARSEKVMYISKVKYGSYDTIMKTMLEHGHPRSTGVYSFITWRNTSCATQSSAKTSGCDWLWRYLCYGA